ncbi:hypothetical protein D3C80_1679760 [compost metagenome]
MPRLLHAFAQLGIGGFVDGHIGPQDFADFGLGAHRHGLEALDIARLQPERVRDPPLGFAALGHDALQRILAAVQRPQAHGGRAPAQGQGQRKNQLQARAQRAPPGHACGGRVGLKRDGQGRSQGGGRQAKEC